MSPVQVILAALGLALAASLAGNAWLFHERTGLIAAQAATEQLATDTRAAATACSAGVTDLERAARARQTALMGALANIAPTVAAYQGEAIASLNAKPDKPEDLCGSLERFLRAQIGRERKR